MKYVGVGFLLQSFELVIMGGGGQPKDVGV